MTRDREWILEVTGEKTKALNSDKKPLEILVEVFKYCQDDFDINDMKIKMPKLYEILQEFCNKIPENIEELRNNSREVVEYFNEYKTNIKEHDIELFYALLNFVDMLKVSQPVT